MAIDPNQFWDSNYYNHPSLSDAMVVEAERRLGVTLPPDFIALLRIQNGGYTKGFAYPMKKKTTWAEDHVPLHDLAGIVTGPEHQTPLNILQTEYMTQEWGLPPKQVLLSGDGHWWITLDYPLFRNMKNAREESDADATRVSSDTPNTVVCPDLVMSHRSESTNFYGCVVFLIVGSSAVLEPLFVEFFPEFS